MKARILLLPLLMLYTACEPDPPARGTLCGTWSSTDCPSGCKLCNGVCVDVSTDPANCGDCASRCLVESGFYCEKGQCKCVGDLTKCDRQCVDTSSDGNNCGSCGSACPADQTCTNGQCI